MYIGLKGYVMLGRKTLSIHGESIEMYFENLKWECVHSCFTFKIEPLTSKQCYSRNFEHDLLRGRKSLIFHFHFDLTFV